MQRAYSVFQIRSIDEDARVITGIATTPKTDRMDDIVEPEGAVFKLPLPFLWQHNSREPVGHVTRAKVGADGIEIEAKLVKFDEPGDLKNLLDKAWGMIKTGLVRGLSIGFNPKESADIEGTWGKRFTRWEFLELSAVTIPANIDCTIQTIKQFDTRTPAATGKDARAISPRARGSVKSITSQPGAGTMKVTEQIKQFEATRQAKAARMDELMAKAAEKGETLDAAQEEEYDGLAVDVESVDKHLVRLRAQEEMNRAAATVVAGNGSEEAGKTRGGIAVVKSPEKLEPGIEFARFAMCVAAARGNVPQALALAETHYPQQVAGISVLKSASRFGMSIERYLDSALQAKAAVPAGTTTDATWAAPLLAYNTFAGDFLEFLRPLTLIGRFGQDGIPDLRRIPFNVHIKGQTSGGTGYWVGQGKPKPVTKYDFVDAYHGFTKVAAIAVLTEELIRFSDPSAERLVRDALSGSLIERVDTDLFDPAVAAVAGVSPASLTNGVAAVPGSGGTTADDVRADIAALWAAAMAANLPLDSAVYVTTPSIALNLSLMMNPLGQREFGDMSMKGGKLLGVPTIVSNYIPAGTLILAFASEIYLSDDGQVSLDASREASIQMLDNPTNDSAIPTPTTMVSMFQTDSVALRAHRFINWSKRRTTAVALIEDVEWGGLGS